MSRSSSRGRRLSTVPRSAQHDGKRRSRGCFALFAQIGKRSGCTAKPAARCQLTLEPGPRAGAKNGPGLPSDGRTVRRPDARPTAAAHRVPPSPHWHGRSGGARLQKGRAPPNTAPRCAPLPSKAPHAGAAEGAASASRTPGRCGSGPAASGAMRSFSRTHHVTRLGVCAAPREAATSQVTRVRTQGRRHEFCQNKQQSSGRVCSRVFLKILGTRVGSI